MCCSHWSGCLSSIFLRSGPPHGSGLSFKRICGRLQVPARPPCLNQEHLFCSLFYILGFGMRFTVMNRVPSLQWTIEPPPSHPEALGPEVSPAASRCGCRGGGTQCHPSVPNAYLMVTSACSPYSFCSRAFRKDISVCSGASCGDRGVKGELRFS